MEVVATEGRYGTMVQSPDFDSIKQTGVYGEEYWFARDLLPLLGYKRWDTFKEAIEGAKVALDTNQTQGNHISPIRKMVRIGSGAQREVDEYVLSRLGCYLIAQNGDPRKPEIAAAQNYFAVSTRQNEIHQLLKEQEERLETRLKVSDSYKALTEAAHNAGVQSESFGIFIDAGYVGLHRHTLQELKERKGIPEKEDYLDRITREELSAIDFKNTQTEKKLARDQVSGLDEAAQTHYFVGDQVRKAIDAINGPMPEDLPSAPSIRKMIEERNRKKKRGLKAKDEGQDKLF